MDSDPDILTLHIQNQSKDLEKLNDFLQMISERWQIPVDIILPVNLALEEVFTNILKYGYTDQADHEIQVHVERFDDHLRVQVTDDGVPFNPLERIPPDTSRQASERDIGGLGILLIRQMMDAVEYSRSGIYNVLTMKKIIK